MKVQIHYTVDVDDEFRAAINRWYGRDGLATREEVKRWWRQYGGSMNDDLSMEIAENRDYEKKGREEE